MCTLRKDKSLPSKRSRFVYSVPLYNMQPIANCMDILQKIKNIRPFGERLLKGFLVQQVLQSRCSEVRSAHGCEVQYSEVQCGKVRSAHVVK